MKPSGKQARTFDKVKLHSIIEVFDVPEQTRARGSFMMPSHVVRKLQHFSSALFDD
jgi:hypothetical protein